MISFLIAVCKSDINYPQQEGCGGEIRPG